MRELADVEEYNGSSWFTPGKALVVFSMINLLTYLDRGAFSACLDTIEKDLKLSNTDGGFVGSAYLIGFVAASMLFAQISQRFQPLRFMACALIVWCMACVGSGFGYDFYTLCVARCCTGVGEAAFIILAPPFIDIAAPTEKRSEWLSIFYVAIPLGYAIGFVLGGKLLDADMLGQHWTWRVIFMAESALMIPLILISLLVTGPSSLKALAAHVKLQTQLRVDGAATSESHVVPSDYRRASNAIPVAASASAAAASENPYQSVNDDGSHALLPNAGLPNEGYGSVPAGTSYRSSVDGSPVCYDLRKWAPPPNLVLGAGMTGDGRAPPASHEAEWRARAQLGGSGGSGAANTPAAVLDANDGEHDDLAAMGECDRLKTQMRMLVWNGTYVSIVLGYAAISFVTGGFAYFGIQFLQKQYGWDVGAAGLAFGGITAFTGIVGTGFGGYWVDRARRKRRALDDATASEVGMQIILIFTILAWPVCCLGFVFSNTWVFFVCTFIAEFFMFSTFSPVNSVLMWVVPIPYRPMSMALSVLGIHLLGDALSPIIIGYLVDRTGDWNLSMLIMSLWLFWGVVFYWIAYRLAKRANAAKAMAAPAEGSLNGVVADDGRADVDDSFQSDVGTSLLGSSARS